MKDDEKCGNCDFYKPLSGRCRLNPPVFTIYEFATGGTGRIYGTWEQAYVDPDMQCSHWAPRADDGGFPSYPPADVPPPRNVAERVKQGRAPRPRQVADVMMDHDEEETR